MIVKLNEGVSGAGNALVDLAGLPAPGPGRARRGDGIGSAAMQFERHDIPLDAYLDKLAERWRHRRGADLRRRAAQPQCPAAGHFRSARSSCSRPTTSCWVVPSGQSYLGCRFPADIAYARAISGEAEKIGARLAREGVLGRFAIDFVTVRDTSGRLDAVRDRDQPAQGRHDPPVPDPAVPHRRPVRARTRACSGPHWAGRSIWSPPTTSSRRRLRGLSLDDLFDIVARHQLHFDQARQSGVVFHMMSCLTEHGRIGMTAVGDSPADAERTYRRAEKVLLDEARAALVDSPVVG